MGLLDDATEYLRRSGRNLGMGGQYAANVVSGMLDNAQANNAAVKAGAAVGAKALSGQEPTPEEWQVFHASPALGFGTDAGAPGGGLLGMFAGARSKTANPQLLQKAKNLIAGGAKPDDVRVETGWMQGHDGEWKYEISDHKARLVQDKRGTWKLDHPELRRAYPDILNKLKIEWFDGPAVNMGKYDTENHVMHLNRGLQKDLDQAASVALHEIQHPIQDIEGFSPGASPGHTGILAFSNAERDLLRKQHIATVDEYESTFNAWKDERLKENSPRFGRMKTSDLRDMFERSLGDSDLPRRYERAADELSWMDTPRGASWFAHNAYERAMGEYEARETQLRQDLTPDERRDMVPYQHPGQIPPERLIDMRLLQFDDPPTLQGLLNRTLGPSPEQAGMALSLLGTPLYPDDAQ